MAHGNVIQMPSEQQQHAALIETVGKAVESLFFGSSIAKSPSTLAMSDIYAALPVELRRQLRSCKLSLSNCLSKFFDMSSSSPRRRLHISADGLSVSKGTDTSSANAQPVQQQERGGISIPAAPRPQEQKTIRVIQPLMSSESTRNFSAHDFCFHVRLSEIPAPPKPIATVEDFTSTASGKTADNVFSVSSFVGLIPTYFVPVREVLEHLPGYTSEHITQYLGCCKTVQIVSIDGEQFIRLHGGYGQLDLTGTGEAEALFPQYSIRLERAQPFIDAFEDVRDRWMPLAQLLQRAGAAAEAALPYQGKKALLFFAQLQHIFSFAPDDGGAVLLRRPFFAGLDVTSSPSPKACSNVLSLLPLHDQVDFNHFLQQLSDDAKLDISRTFPSVEHFLRSHGELFYLSDDKLTVMRSRHKKLLDLRALPLAAQLEIALRDRQKKRVRALRRQINLQENADHPLLNPDNLAREIVNYIPKKGHIPVKQLFKRVLPVELLNFMPKNYSRIFKNYPQYFQLYELGMSTHWCVSRAGQPLPQGAIRKEFSEDDCVSIFAELLQARGPKSVSFLSLHLPEGVRDYIKKCHGALVTFAMKHKEYFSVVHTIDTGVNKESACVITLIQMPLRREAGGSVGDDVDDDDDDDDDEDQPRSK